MAREGTTTDYNGVFDPEWYLDTYYGSVADQVSGHVTNQASSQSDGVVGNQLQFNLLQFNLEKYHDIFQYGDVKGRRLLDVGTGPSVHSVISACRHVDDVYLTDFAAQNRKVLNDWWKSDKTTIVKVTEYILRKENSSETVAERHKTIKEKVRHVLPIDVTLSDPLGSGCDVNQFDIITSSLCLEAAAQTLDQYRSNAANVSSLLKSGGHFILNGVLEQTWYRIGEAKFSCVKLTRDDIKSTFVSCGFNIQLFDDVKFKSKEDEYSDFHGYFVMHAIKE
ncbi:Indolethylamine N-methyltransferase [Mizuhopecten yessoensis]|uniref:Indolethylamine N-methyltransferase n=2 Tax=Mizuhopecten yessoensis TaxID=6573 RepID=A0A210R774_MIZYE|nr:Indolethylamine N-methyltransferase [Mizuhopecten yessoensis]